MQLHFRTCDLGSNNDYPAIGWMPPLPAGADGLWRRFGNLGSAEHPQMVLSQEGGNWVLYLEGMDSGRTDSPSGKGGRRIRMSLYLKGSADEGASVMQLISSFVGECLTGLQTNGMKLREIFAQNIKPGDPCRWKAEGAGAQSAAAVALLNHLASQTAPDVEDCIDIGWSGAVTQENVARFLGTCQAVLTGKVSGVVLSLAYMRLNDVPEIRRILGNEPLVAALSVHKPDKEARQFEPPAMSSSQPMGTPEGQDADRNDGRVRGRKVMAFFAIALCLGLLMLLMRSCGSVKTGTTLDTTDRTVNSTGGAK